MCGIAAGGYCIRASSEQDEKRANRPRSVRTRVCLELGNLVDEQPLQCPVPPSSSSVLWCRPSHSSQSCINSFLWTAGRPPLYPLSPYLTQTV